MANVKRSAGTSDLGRYEHPTSVAEAERIQERLKRHLDLDNHLEDAPTLVAGVDVSYDKNSPRITAAAVMMNVTTGEEVEAAVVHGEVSFPYVPGLLAFREVPILLAALGRLVHRPEVVGRPVAVVRRR